MNFRRRRLASFAALYLQGTVLPGLAIRCDGVDPDALAD
jgi:hypothetical protein